MNNTRKVNAETKERVLKVIKDLEYSPSPFARSLRTKETRTLGVVTDDVDNYFFTEVIEGIESVCYETDFAAFLVFNKSHFERETRVVMELERRGIEGLILHSCQPDSRLETLLADLKIPVITFQRHLAHWQVDSLCTDDASGASQAMAHLRQRGHQRIAIFNGDMFASHSAKQRFQTWRELCENWNLARDSQLEVDGGYTFDSGYAAMQKILSMPKSQWPTAVFAIADRPALGAIRATLDFGLRIPEDMAFVGYDNLKFLEYCYPPLTTVDHKAREQGIMMAQQVLARIKEPKLAPCQLKVEPHLVIRSTS